MPRNVAALAPYASVATYRFSLPDASLDSLFLSLRLFVVSSLSPVYKYSSLPLNVKEKKEEQTEREEKEKSSSSCSLSSFLRSSITLAASAPSNRDQMARALCSSAALAATLSDGIAVLISRRGYAGAAAVTGTGASRGRSVEEKVARKGTVGSSSSSSSSDSWVPDPVTGYYRPGNRRVEVDAAELREMLLSHKSQH